MLDVRQLSSRRDGVPVFQPVSLQIQGHQCVELLGENGAGKTTLLRTLAGLHTHYQGSYSVGSQNKLLFQGHRLGLDEVLSALENLTWFGQVGAEPVDHEQIRQVLDRVGMLAHALVPCGKLSQGQQRRISMARWLLSSAQLWLLDEPLTALDVAGQDLLVEVIQAHCAGGGAVCYSTHTPMPITDKQQLELCGWDAQRDAYQ